jgi:hypothetical protein
LPWLACALAALVSTSVVPSEYVIVVVVIPFTVVETSLTTVLDEPPLPPEPELPPAASEVAEVDDDVEDVAEVDDVEDVDEDDVAALVGVAVIAAVEAAIALIDMGTSPEESSGHGIDGAPRCCL